ncbi:ABC transporter ATP-binding protein/permease [Ascidiaceihabitans sp.]|nr:ABC transporter ATP-binding protein/permease [Ascidiaceihabitans sp.]
MARQTNLYKVLSRIKRKSLLLLIFMAIGVALAVLGEAATLIVSFELLKNVTQESLTIDKFGLNINFYENSTKIVFLSFVALTFFFKMAFTYGLTSATQALRTDLLKSILIQKRETTQTGGVANVGNTEFLKITIAELDFAIGNIFAPTANNVISAVTIIFYVAAFLIFDPYLASFVIGAILLFYAAMFVLTASTTRKLGRSRNTLTSKRHSHMDYISKKAKPLFLNMQFNVISDDALVNSKKLGENYASTALLSSIPKFILELIFTCLVVLTAVYSNQVVGSDQLLPVAAMVFISATRLLPQFNAIFQNTTTIRHALESFKLDEFIPIPKELSEPPEFSVDGHIRKIIFDGRLGNSDLLAGVFVEFNAGEIYLIRGPSGSGKTTLIEAICGLRSEFSRAVSFVPYHDHNECTAPSYQICYVGYEPALISGTIWENIKLLNGNFSSIDESKLKDLFSTLSLNNRFEEVRSAADITRLNYSVGELQRLNLIISLMCLKKTIFIFDEPTANLDEINTERFFEFIQTNFYKKDDLVIVVTHDTPKHSNELIEVELNQCHLS